MTETASIQQLLDDHKYSESRFAELCELLEQFKLDNTWSPERVRTFERFAEYFRVDLMVHMRKEDEILYPALEEFLPRDVGPLMVLRTEHDDIVSNFNRMQNSYQLMLQGNVRPEVAQKFLFFGTTLLQLLHDHAYKEERVLFPMVARFLRPELDARLAGEMETLSRAAHEITHRTT
jgi:regulator of cell morphogenesis and NO signaling